MRRRRTFLLTAAACVPVRIFAGVVVLVATSGTLHAARVTDGLIVFYPLDEGSGTAVHDLSGFGKALDLPFVEGDAGWIDRSGLSITVPTEIASKWGEARKVYDALTKTNSFTIEAWIDPRNDTQGDRFNPAVIVTMAAGLGFNFSLSQNDGDYIGDVDRSLNSGATVVASAAVKSGVRQHVVYTSSEASAGQIANIYVDRRLIASVRESQWPLSWRPDYPLGLVNRPQAMLPWLGEIFLVAIYDRPLSLVEVAQNYRCGPNVRGDFNADLCLDATDIESLSAEFRAGTNNRTFDLNNDLIVNQEDRRIWIEEKDARNTYYGDVNFDGEFNSSDLVSVFQVGEYEDTVKGNSTWTDGDWNGSDSEFDSSDLVIAFQRGGFEQGPRVAVVTVPEPPGSVLLACVILCVHLALRWTSIRDASANQATSECRD